MAFSTCKINTIRKYLSNLHENASSDTDVYDHDDYSNTLLKINYSSTLLKIRIVDLVEATHKLLVEQTRIRKSLIGHRLNNSNTEIEWWYFDTRDDYFINHTFSFMNDQIIYVGTRSDKQCDKQVCGTDKMEFCFVEDDLEIPNPQDVVVFMFKNIFSNYA